MLLAASVNSTPLENLDSLSMDVPSVPVDMPLAGLEVGMERRRASLFRYAESWMSMNQRAPPLYGSMSLVYQFRPAKVIFLVGGYGG
jgi:hypothetical protein